MSDEKPKEWHIPKIDFVAYYNAAKKYQKPGDDKIHVILKSEYDQLMKDALKLKRALECFEDTAYGHKATEVIENFDKKYCEKYGE